MRFIAFDCDGTLIDSQMSIIKGIQYAWNQHNITPPNVDAIRRIIGLPLHQAIQTLSPNLPLETVQSLSQTYLERFKNTDVDFQTEEILFDNVHTVLDQLNTESTVMAVVTGKGRHGLRKTVERQDLAPYFSIYKSADCGPGKPNPHVLLDAMTQAGADKNNSVIIGDTTYDIHMGKNAGIKTIGVSFGYHAVKDLQNAGADMIVNNFAEIPNAIDIVLS